MSRTGVPSRPILPGATVGVVGAGQLGRMLAMAAQRMGYRVHVLEPTADAPATAFADHVTVAAYDDVGAVEAFARAVDVLTLEFENVSSQTLAAAAEIVPVRPGPSALHVCQDRAREKRFLRDRGLPHVPYEVVGRTTGEGAAPDGPDPLAAALARVGTPAVVKTAGFGYDGKGQVLVEGEGAAGHTAALERAHALLRRQAVVVERFADLAAEVSVVIARGVAGEVRAYPYFVNRHERHVLDVTVSPWSEANGATPTPHASTTWDLPDPSLRPRAAELARAVVEALDYVGVACVEFFVTGSGELLVNEIAPRPHNSGHLTIEASATSQFEQQLRAVCGLPLGAATMVRPAAMVNLLGDLWQGGEPAWSAALAEPGVALHLYGKREARPGRKMGHLTATATSVDGALAKVTAARDALRRARR